MDSIDHFAINVKDIKASVSWYTTSFSCAVLYQDNTFALLEFSNIKLALILPSQQPSHVAFKRKDAHTLGELRKQKDGSKSTFIADPTGNMIEIMSKE